MRPIHICPVFITVTSLMLHSRLFLVNKGSHTHGEDELFWIKSTGHVSTVMLTDKLVNNVLLSLSNAAAVNSSSVPLLNSYGMEYELHCLSVLIIPIILVFERT